MFIHQNLYPYNVKTAFNTYQSIRKITALLLLLSFLIPSGLLAKQLAEFCMPMTDHHEDMGMMADHSCCQTIPEKTETNEHQQNHCDEASFCTCSITERNPGEDKFLQPLKKHISQPAVTELQTPFFSEDQPIQTVIHTIPVSIDIPLWLMFDTFLM